MAVPAENIMRLLPDAEPPSKAALTRYFKACAESCLEHLGRRFLTLVRHVEGVTFFHKGPLPPVPPAVRQTVMRKADGTTGVRLWVDDVAGLLGLLEIGVVELHPWGATVDDIEHPDRLIFDLDPDDAVPWEHVMAAALELRDFLESAGLPSWSKTTGGKGLHLVVPMPRKLAWKDASAFAKAAAQGFAARDLERFTTTAGAKARAGGRIFMTTCATAEARRRLGPCPRGRAPVGWFRCRSAGKRWRTVYRRRRSILHLRRDG